jgi:hypothetical protein
MHLYGTTFIVFHHEPEQYVCLEQHTYYITTMFGVQSFAWINECVITGRNRLDIQCLLENRHVPNGTHDGVRGWKTKARRKRLRFPPARLLV